MTIIGIDLGTSTTCAAVYQDGCPELIFGIQDGERVFPSYVAMSEGKWLVGALAKELAPENLQHTVIEAKRLIGRPFPYKKAFRRLSLWPFKFEGKMGKYTFVWKTSFILLKKFSQNY